MSHRRLARILLVFLVTTLLCAPAWAMPGRSAFESRLLDILARLWGSLTAVWTESGCKLDPYGGSTDHGCKLDPNGGSAASEPTTDSGCKIDPHGGCVPGS